MKDKRIRYGMIGGGEGSFIGAVHRKAAAMDGHLELVCGAFSSKADKSRRSGAALGLPEDRIYASYDEMMRAEAQQPTHQQMQAVAIVTPNHVHFEPAMMALDHGFHVIIDKPITFSLAQAKKLHAKVEETGLLLALTHTYTGYPMIKEARKRIAGGAIGRIKKIFVEYPQGWLSTPLEQEGNKQASWRTDPEKSGAGGCIGDIGTHAANLAEYVSGARISRLCADVNTVVEGRLLDDDAAALLRFDNGASGVLMATQVAAGEENNLKLRIYGTEGGFEWSHTDPNTLLYKPLDAPVQVLRAGNGYLSSAAANNFRIPPGHPEGYLEAFANIYVSFAKAVQHVANGEAADTDFEDGFDFPGAADGVRGMAFVENMLCSAATNEKWTDFEV
ncbi:MAG: Gfo/Idh/MocA family protein [Cyclonatronaceae bacterium]